MPTYLIRHTTTYRYSAAVELGRHRTMLHPRESHDQHVAWSDLAIEPKPSAFSQAEDASGNLVGTAHFAGRAKLLSFVAEARVDVIERDLAEMRLHGYAQHCPFSYGAEEMPDLARFIERQHLDPDRTLDQWTRAILAEDPTRDTWAFLTRLNAAIRQDFAYLRREEKGIQTPAETLGSRRGSCRDFAVLMIEAVRSQGVAARFVSGYLRVHTDPRARMAGGSTHAWLQVYLPGAGWIDFDPTSGTVGNADLVRVAVVRDPEQATPLAGTFRGLPNDYLGMSVSVDVRLADQLVENAA